MVRGFSRRDFLRLSALASGGLVAAGIGTPLLLGEKGAVFDPNNSYWAQERIPLSPPLRYNLAVDVAIIGGGYTGLSAAWHLAKNDPSLNIVLLEAGQVGHGASGRHGGMVLPQTSADSFEIAHNLDAHAKMYDLTVKGMQAMRRLVASTGADCDLRLNGYVHAFLDEEDRSYYEGYVAQVRAEGMPLELWNEDDTARALGTEIYSGAVYDPNGGSVHAMKLIRALKSAARDAGVHIFENSPVTGVEAHKTVRLRVGGENHSVQAKAVVLATNAYTSKLGFFNNQVIPVHAQTAVTGRLTARQLASTGWNSRLPYYDSRNLLYHVVLTPDDRIVIGGGSAEYGFRNDLRYRGDLAGVSTMLRAELHRMYPTLKDVRFDWIWNGVLGMSFDGVPAVGVTGRHRNIYYGLAYSGEGVNLAFVFGDVIASLYREEEHDWFRTPYAHYSLPFVPPEPFRWLGVQGILKYYRWSDRR